MITEENTGAGIICRAYQLGGVRQKVAQRVLRRFWREGKQIAFAYHNAWDARPHLERLRLFMAEDEETQR
jgi:hypothetical protein